MAISDARRSHVPFESNQRDNQRGNARPDQTQRDSYRNAPRRADARQATQPTKYLGSVPIRQPRFDPDGNVKHRYSDKPMTEWPEIDNNCKTPFLASYGVTADNWEAKKQQPCIICNVYGEADHKLGHCLFIFSCCERGRIYFGAAKAAERARALQADGVRSVRDLIDTAEAAAGETSPFTRHAMCTICDLGGIREDDDATAYTDMCVDMESFPTQVYLITGPTDVAADLA
jgi:hypothetical protein